MPETAVWAQAVSDLQAAAASLPLLADQPKAMWGRATKGAALGYLGKAYVYQRLYANAVGLNRALPC